MCQADNLIGGVHICGGGDLILKRFLRVNDQIGHGYHHFWWRIREVQLKVVHYGLIGFIGCAHLNEKNLGCWGHYTERTGGRDEESPRG